MHIIGVQGSQSETAWNSALKSWGYLLDLGHVILQHRGSHTLHEGRPRWHLTELLALDKMQNTCPLFFPSFFQQFPNIYAIYNIQASPNSLPETFSFLFHQWSSCPPLHHFYK